MARARAATMIAACNIRRILLLLDWYSWFAWLTGYRYSTGINPHIMSQSRLSCNEYDDLLMFGADGYSTGLWPEIRSTRLIIATQSRATLDVYIPWTPPVIVRAKTSTYTAQHHH